MSVEARATSVCWNQLPPLAEVIQKVQAQDKVEVVHLLFKASTRFDLFFFFLFSPSSQAEPSSLDSLDTADL